MQRASRNYTFYMHKHICLRSWMTKLIWQALFHGPNLQDLRPWNAKIRVICVCGSSHFRGNHFDPIPNANRRSSRNHHNWCTFSNTAAPAGPVQFHTIPHNSTAQPLPTPTVWSYLPIPDLRVTCHQTPEGKVTLVISKTTERQLEGCCFFQKRKTYRGTHVANAGCQPLRCSFHLLWRRSCNISAGGCIFFEKYEFINDHPIKTYKNM